MSTTSGGYQLLCALYRKVLQKEWLRRNIEARGLPLTWFSTEPLEQRMLFTAVSWDGGGDGTNWTDPRNWSGDVLPAAADDVTISVAANPTIKIASGTQSINSLVSDEAIQVTGGTLQIGTTAQISNALGVSGGTANFNGAATVAGGLTFTSGTIGGTGSLTVGGPSTWSGGLFTGTGSTTFAGGLSITGPSQKTLTQRTVANAGAATWDGGVVSNGSGATFSNLAGATFTVAFGGTWDNGQNGSLSTFANAGTVTKTGTATATFNVAFNNAGSVDVQGGTLSPTQGTNPGGGISIAAGASFQFNSGFVVSGGQVTGLGTASFVGGTQTFGTRIFIYCTRGHHQRDRSV